MMSDANGAHKDPASGGIEYCCSVETLKKYRSAPDEWKLNWLEEVNGLVRETQKDHEKRGRELLRKGGLFPQRGNAMTPNNPASGGTGEVMGERL